MIRDKGFSVLSLSPVDPQKVGNRTKTEEFSPMSVALDRSRTATIAKQPRNSASAEDESDVSTLIARLTAEVNQVACEKTKSIQKITNQMKMLALNALIESRAPVRKAPALPWWRRKSATSASRSKPSPASSRASSPTGPAI